MDHTGGALMLLNTTVETRKWEVVTVIVQYLHVHAHKTNLLNLNCLFSTTDRMKNWCDLAYWLYKNIYLFFVVLIMFPSVKIVECLMIGSLVNNEMEGL